jgi:chain length determinant protein EpsF
MNFLQLLLILRARKWIVLGALLVTVTTTVLVSIFLLPKEYTANATLVVDSKSKEPFTGQLIPSQMFPGYMATQVDIIKSKTVGLKVIDGLKLVDAPGTHEKFMESTEGKGDIRNWLADLFLKKLEVEPSRESSIIQISFDASDPQFAAIVANAFAKSYIETNLEFRVEPARQTAAWFDNQITQLREDLETAQTKLSDFQRDQGIVESEERMDVESRRMAELSSQMVAAKSATYDSTSRVGQSSALPEVINNPVVQNLKTQLAQGEARLADLASKMGKNHPQYQSLNAELQILRDNLDNEIRTATKGVSATASAARQREGSLTAAYEAQKKRVLGQKQQREELMLLVGEVQNAQRIYDAALARYGQTRMEAQSTQTDITILNPAIPPTESSKPRVFLNVMLAVFLGTMLGVVMAFMMEMLDRRMRSAYDIAGFGIPVLGELRKIPSGRLRNRLRRMLSRKTQMVVS